MNEYPVSRLGHEIIIGNPFDPKNSGPQILGERFSWPENRDNYVSRAMNYNAALRAAKTDPSCLHRLARFRSYLPDSWQQATTEDDTLITC